VIAGPFVGELGFELLYWIPALRRLLGRHGIDPAQVTAVSRGGADLWYRDIAGSYVDAYDLLPPEEFTARLRRRRGQAGDSKQLGPLDLDLDLLDAARGLGRLDDPVVVHPSAMYTRLRYLWADERPMSVAGRRLEFARLEAERPAGLPGHYVALKVYTSDCLPATDENSRVLTETVGRLAEHTPVVLLSDQAAYDDHRDFGIRREPGVVRSKQSDPRHNLADKASVVAGASALVCTYGGFSYLGAFLGVPAVTLHSHATFNPVHPRVARLACSTMGLPAPTMLGMSDSTPNQAIAALGAADGAGLHR
jgi:hypothetical protein